MRVLITNMRLARFSGSEVAAELVADGLRRAGHEPVVYAPALGDQAERMRVRGHIVADRLGAIPFRPDVIHAQHSSPAIMAMAAFPDVPVVHVCHSARFAQEAAIIHPQVRRYVAVDELCRQRCLADGAPRDRLSIVHNPVDLERFVQRPPLPAKPKRALLLTKTKEQRLAVLAACKARGIEVVELGPGVGRVSASIEEELPGFDIVFATARMALEAAAVGCAVVVADGRGMAGMLTSARWPEWRRQNLGAALLAHPVTAEGLGAALDDYDPDDARAVSSQVRTAADLEGYTQEMIALYRLAVDEGVTASASELALRNATLLEDWLPTPTDRPWRQLATEKRWIPDWERELLSIEARLEAAGEKQRVRLKRHIEALGGEMRERFDLLAAVARPAVRGDDDGG
ncbi:glycosyltransferase family 4 protein [Brevundimonas sp.]|uniref:glycosyltransferase family 4 protein n=1 Tax=Brevundimonas sp. TaxID=1871086 RepID=UPI003D6CE81C